MPNAVSIDRQSQGDRRPQGRRNERPNDLPKEEKIFSEHVVAVDRVARVVKGGRRFRFKALVAVGDGKNRVGIGVAKSQDVQGAVAKATDKAKKNLLTFPVVNATIPHDVEAKVGGAKVLLRAAAPGTGIIAGGTVRSIVNLTGVTNLLGKALGSNNKVNNAYATLAALRQLVPKEQWVKKNEGKTVQAVEKVEKAEPAAKPKAKKETK